MTEQQENETSFNEGIAEQETGEVKTFTQEEVSSIATKQAAIAKRKAAAEFAEQLGVSIEEAKKIIAENAQQREAAKTELEKAQEQAATAQANAEKAIANANAERLNLRIENALIKAGVTTSTDKISKLVEVDIDATATEIAEAVETLKTEMPGLFGSSVNVDTTSVKKPQTQTSVNVEEQANELAKAFNARRGL